MIDGLMAESLLSNGGPSILYWAQRLQQLPLSLVAVAATNAVFPLLTALGQQRDHVRLRKLHDDTHLAIAFVAVPATVGLYVLAEPILRVCFHHGAFGDEGIARAVGALHGLTAAILPAGAAALVARTYYALDDYRTPVRVAVVLLVANSILNVVFVKSFGMDVGGLTWSTAVTAWLNLVLLLPGLRSKHGLGTSAPGLALRLAKIVLASALAGAAAFGAWELASGRLGEVLALVAAISSAVVVCRRGLRRCGRGARDRRVASRDGALAKRLNAVTRLARSGTRLARSHYILWVQSLGRPHKLRWGAPLADGGVCPFNRASRARAGTRAPSSAFHGPKL
jgi:putative peptidoglycan lipid II flippase